MQLQEANNRVRHLERDREEQDREVHSKLILEREKNKIDRKFYHVVPLCNLFKLCFHLTFE